MAKPSTTRLHSGMEAASSRRRPDRWDDRRRGPVGVVCCIVAYIAPLHLEPISVRKPASCVSKSRPRQNITSAAYCARGRLRRSGSPRPSRLSWSGHRRRSPSRTFRSSSSTSALTLIRQRAKVRQWPQRLVLFHRAPIAAISSICGSFVVMTSVIDILLRSCCLIVAKVWQF